VFDIVWNIGADHVILYTKECVEEKVKELTNGQGTNVYLYRYD
jgi:NADPH:quinone reductase-like Zn-dependent oxidoreductase